MNINNLCMKCMSKVNEDGICLKCGFNKSNYQQSAHHLPLNTILAGKYIVGTVLGEGGFGITYMGYNINLDLAVAIKEYYPNGLVTRENNTTVNSYVGDKTEIFQKGKKRFLDEARILGRFNSKPGVVSVNDFFAENETVYIVMEYIEGSTFKSYLAKMRGNLPANQVFEMMKPVIKTLGEIHENGTIHRDISPDNLMITKDGEVKLLDFGAAREFGEAGNKSLSVMLKPGYAPEEQYRSRGQQGPWTDIYALCATMYKCITGIVPDESSQRLIKDELEPLSNIGVSISEHEEQVLLKGLAVHQDDRYQSIKELYTDLYEPTKKKFKPIIKDEDFEKEGQAKVNNLSGFEKLKRSKLLKILSMVLIIAIVGFVLFGSSSKTDDFTDEDIIVWADENFEKVVREYLEIEDEDILVGDVSNLSFFSISQYECDEEDLIESLEDLKYFKSLISLNINFNDLISDLSPLENLTKLEYLELYGCDNIVDLSVIEKLEELNELQVNFCNKLTDISVVSNILNLTTLYISNCDALKDISVIGTLTDLTSLYLHGFHYLQDLSLVKNLTNLTNLSIVSCYSLTDIDDVENLTSLIHLSLRDCEEIQDISVLENLENLTTLNLSYCVKVSDISVLEKLSYLNEVDVDGCENIIDYSPILDLTAYGLPDNVFTNQSVIVWADENFEREVRELLGIETADITVESVKYLTTLKLWQSNEEDDGYIQSLEDLKYFGNLTSFYLQWSIEIVDISPIASLTKLVDLSLIGCESIVDFSALEGLTNLQVLCLGACDGLSDLSPLSNLTKLEELDLTSCRAITDLGPLSYLSELRILDLSYASGISDLTPLENLKYLSELYLVEDIYITDYSPVDHVGYVLDANMVTL